MTFQIDAAASDSRKKLLVEKYLTRVEWGPWFVDACADADPTPNGLNTEWLVKTFRSEAFAKSQEEMFDRLEDLTEMLTEFGRLKNNPEWVRTMTAQRGRDAGNLQTYTYEELVEVLGEATRENLSKKERERELRRKRQKYLDEGAETVGTVDQHTIYQATTGEAGALLAEGTAWCTKNVQTAANYIKRGSLYVFMEEESDGWPDYRKGSTQVPTAQCYIPEDVSRMEFEDPTGRDLYSLNFNDRAVWVRPDWWWVIEFLAKHNARLRNFVDKSLVYTDGMEFPEFQECAYCEEIIDEGDGEHVPDPVTGDTIILCDSNCFDSYYEDYVKDQVSDLVIYDSFEGDAATAQLDEILYRGGGSETTKKVVTTMIESAKRQHMPNTHTSPPRGGWEFEAAWYLDNATTSLRYFKSGEPSRIATIEKVLPGLTEEEFQIMVDEVKPLAEKAGGKNKYVDKAVHDVRGEFHADNMDVGRILEALGYQIKKLKKSYALLHKQAKAIDIPTRFTDVMTDLILEIFEKVYQGSDPSLRLKDVVRRDTSWEIERSDWESRGVDFKRSGGLELDGLLVVLETDPDKATAQGQPSPVIYSAGVNIQQGHRIATVVLTLNGNMTIQAGMDQLRQHDQNIRMILKHEFAHLYDRQFMEDKDHRTEEDEDDATYLNRPHEVRAWVTTLLEEFDQFVSKQRGEFGNELVNSFLKGSRVWSLLSQNLNAQNRRVALREISRKLETLKGERHGKQMVDRNSK